MKKIIFIALFLGLFAFGASVVEAKTTKVKSYYKPSTNSYVKSYYKTSPNKTLKDNYSTKGNYNPYTGKSGTKKIYSW